MLPGTQETHHDIVRDVRQNKGSILKASVEYIRRLKRDNTAKKSLEEKCRIQEFQNRKLLVKLQVGTTTEICLINRTMSMDSHPTHKGKNEGREDIDLLPNETIVIDNSPKRIL